MNRFIWFIVEALCFFWCAWLEFIEWLGAQSLTGCASALMFVVWCMSIFKKVAAWPWKKILTVVVKVASWLLDKLPADAPKTPKA
jgi:hypothetical protein